jgi:hypothetical protein
VLFTPLSGSGAALRRFAGAGAPDFAILALHESGQNLILLQGSAAHFIVNVFGSY